MPLALAELNIHNLRNISHSQFSLHPDINFFIGPNGSGKTSILETIYLLGCGHSFRTRETSPLIQSTENSFTVFARMNDNQTIGIQKSLKGPTVVKLNGNVCASSSKLAHFLPMQVIYQDIFQIIDSAPSTRRGLLDWGLFHVEPSFFQLWKDYRNVLKQRNALLRQESNYKLFVPWDKQLVALSQQLHLMREKYFIRLSERFNKNLIELSNVECKIKYFKGWDRKNLEVSLEQILINQFATDMQRQYTQSGAHQADILFEAATTKAKSILSRGQQKIILIALKLAQITFLENCVCLFDDVAAELDRNHLLKLFQFIPKVKGQIYMTSTDEQLPSLLLNIIDYKTFNL